MRHHLVWTAHPDVASAKFILAPCVASLGHGALLVAHGVGGFNLFLRPTACVVVEGTWPRLRLCPCNSLLQYAASITSYKFVTRADVIVASGTAAWLSCTEALVSKALIGTPQSAVSMCSL